MSWEDIMKSAQCCKQAKGVFVYTTVNTLKSRGMKFTQDDLDVFSKGVSNAECNGFKLKMSRWSRGKELPKGPQGEVRQIAASAGIKNWRECLDISRDYV